MNRDLSSWRLVPLLRLIHTYWCPEMLFRNGGKLVDDFWGGVLTLFWGLGDCNVECRVAR